MNFYRQVAVSETVNTSRGAFGMWGIGGGGIPGLDAGVTPMRYALEQSLTTYLYVSPPIEFEQRRRVVAAIREWGTLTPTSPVDFYNFSKITALPEGFNPRGDVRLSGCVNLATLPAGFNPQGNVLLADCLNLTALPDRFNPLGTVDLEGCVGLTTLPASFTPKGNAYLHQCASLVTLPAEFNPQGNVDLIGCRSLTRLPERFNPRGSVYLHSCVSLQALPDRFSPNGNVDLRGCTGLASIPESMFAMDRRVTVDLQHAGLNAATVANIIGRMNAPGYSGPQFILSVNDDGYLNESEATADRLPDLIARTGMAPNHYLWDTVRLKTEMGSPWNAFSAFVTRLLNETPRVNGQVPDALNDTMQRIFTAMEFDFEHGGGHLSNCDVINTMLNAAQTGIGTCIDKVKVGYVFMQLAVETLLGFSNAHRKIEMVNTAIRLVSGINSADYVFDHRDQSFAFIRVVDVAAVTPQKLRYHLWLNSFGHYFVDTPQEMTLDRVKRIAIGSINLETGNRFKGFRIGDEVEDILNLIYHLPEMGTLHKIDMRFLGCRTMTAEHEVAAAVRFIRES